MSIKEDYSFFTLDEDEIKVSELMNTEAYGDDHSTRKGRVSTLPGRLSAPLLTTSMCMLTMALVGRREDPAVRLGASLKSQVQFWTNMRELGLSQSSHILREGEASDIVELMEKNPPGFVFPPEGQESLAAYAEICRVVAERVPGVDTAPVSIDYSECTIAAWRWYQALRRPYDRLRRSSPSLDQARVKEYLEVGTLYLAAGGVVFSDEHNKAWYGPLEWFLSALAGAEGLALACLSVDVVKSPSLPSVTPSLILLVARFQRAYVLSYGNWGYPVAKSPEALWKTLASRLSGGSLGEEDSFSRMLKKYAVKEREAAALAGTPFHNLTGRFSKLASRIGTAEEAVEMSGILHMVGYPIIDPSVSAAKSRQMGMSPDTTEISAALDARCIFLHLVCQTYISRKGRWPPIDFFGGNKTRLYEMARSGALLFADKSYPLRDWDGAQIGQIEEIDPFLDWTALINDKSSCAGLSKRQDHYEGRLGATAERRFLAALLATPVLNVEQEMRSMAAGSYVKDDLAADLSQKGTEYKYLGRTFTILPPRIRRGLSGIQENVKTAILPWVPKTSMAMSGQEVERALYEMTTSSGGIPVLKAEADLSSWNLCFKQGFTSIMSRAMSPLVGIPGLFGASHDYFFRTEFMVSVPGGAVPQLDGRAPREANNDVLWRHDGSGKEGIEQRFWTVLTSCMFTLALWDTSFNATLLGQGDNQVLVVPLPGVPTDQLETVAADIMQRIEKTCSRFGHTAKPEEFMESMTMLTYGKTPIINGSKIPLETKFGMKITDSDSEFTQSLEGAIGSISSSALSAARNATVPLRFWLLGSIRIEDFLTRASDGDTWLGRDYDHMCLVFRHPDAIGWALITTAQLGGFPIVPWTSFLYSGAPDPLADALSSILHLSEYAPADNLRRWLRKDTSYRQGPKLTSLLSDPFGIPLRTPVTANSVLRDAAKGVLMGCKNEAVSELARAAAEGGESALVAALCEVRPFFPVMARDMLEISAAGRAAKIAAAFDTSSTLIKMAATPNLLGKYQEASFKRSAATTATAADVLDSTHGAALTGTGFSAAEELRGRWGVSGGIAGISSACPLDYHVSNKGPGILVVVAPFPHTAPPPLIPYLGSKTREKRSPEKYTIAKVSGLQDLKKLVLSYTAGAIDSGLADLYKEIAASRTSLSLDQLVEILPRTLGGTPAHRYDAMRSQATMAPVGNTREGGWISINTDNIPGVSSSPDDWPLPLQIHMSFLISLVRTSVAQGSTRREYWLQVNTDGLTRIDPGTRCLPSAPSLREMMLVGNPLSWVPALTARSASTRVQGTRERPPDVLTPSSARRLASGLLVDALLAPKTRGLASELGGNPLIEVDTLACANLGGLELVRCSMVAVAFGTIWHAITRTGNVEARFVIERLIDNLSIALVPFLWEAISPASVDKTALREEGCWVPGGGSGGVKSLKGHLLAYVRNGARNVLYGWDRFRYEVILPESSVSHPPFFSLLWPIAQSIWIEHIQAGVYLGPLKMAMMSVLKSMRESRIPNDLAGRGTWSAMQRLRLIANSLGGDAQSYTTTIRTMRGTSLELWRVIRRVPRQERELPADPIPYHTAGELTYACFTETGLVNVELRAVVSETTESGLSNEERLDDRSFRPGLRGTTLAEAWHPLLVRRVPKDRKCSILVVGTGRGGIQHLLEVMGYRSTGLDLASTIPIEVMADPHWLPPDCSGLGVYSPLMRSTSGDWFSQEVSHAALSLHRPHMVIIDIETGKQRHLLELVHPLFQYGYSGRVLYRMLATPREIEQVYSVLTNSVGIKNESITAMTEATGLHSRSGVLPVVVAFTMTSKSVLATRGTFYALDEFNGIQFSSVKPEYIPSAISNIISVMTGGHLRHSSVPEALEAARQALRESTGGRGSTEGGSLLTICRGAQAMHEIWELRHMDAWPEASALIVPRRLTMGPIVIPAADPTLRYLREKVQPRLWMLITHPQGWGFDESDSDTS